MAERNTLELPSALSHFYRLWSASDARRLAVFLDYDGTLTPIVERPEMARLAPEMKDAVRLLATRATVAVISGRDLQDVRNLVGLEEICYAGSHGFDIYRPTGERIELEEGKSYLADLDGAEKELEEQLAGIEGSQVERKKYAIAVHFRRVSPADEVGVRRVFDRVAASFPRLRTTGGKKIYELRPDLDWHKGKAVAYLLKTLDLARPGVMPLYIGDDLTDEDAFLVLEKHGVGIVVRDDSRPTAARLALNNTDEVRRFLENLAVIL
ncbi:MAG: trehalose-phosphatase [Desulfuromonadaceae bacterium]|nr:trehalose-phosphatase [Desulfuromonadaceae bacterium]